MTVGASAQPDLVRSDLLRRGNPADTDLGRAFKSGADDAHHKTTDANTALKWGLAGAWVMSRFL